MVSMGWLNHIPGMLATFGIGYIDLRHSMEGERCNITQQVNL